MKINALVAEFLGTFILCFAGIGSIVVATGAQMPVLVCAALAHGLAIAVAGTALGPTSGGHFNPAVSLAMLVSGKINAGTMLAYWGAQFAGAAAGAAVVKFAMPADWVTQASLGIPALNAQTSAGAGFALELIGTFILVLTVFGTAVDSRAPKLGALLIGLSITTMIFAFGPLTGTGINPARWFGPALVSGNMGEIIPYVVGPLVGAILAAMAYSMFFNEKSSEAA